MRGTIILIANWFYWQKTYYFCSVKLRHHLGVDAANRWWVQKQNTNENNKNRNAYDRKRPLDVGWSHLFSYRYCDHSLLRREKVTRTLTDWFQNQKESIRLEKLRQDDKKTCNFTPQSRGSWFCLYIILFITTGAAVHWSISEHMHLISHYGAWITTNQYQ